MKNKSRFKRGFRKNKRIDHPAYLLGRNGDKYDYIGITHSDKTNGKNNIPLKKNPNPNDKRKSYVRPTVESDDPKNFGRSYKDWAFGSEDKKTVQKIYDKSKNKK